MKIALCFSGGIRNFEDNYKSIETNLIRPLSYIKNKQLIKPDIFIHGWYFNVNQLKNTHKIYRGKETSKEKVISLLKPKKYLFEDYDSDKEYQMEEIYELETIKYKYSNNKQLCQLYPNTCGMFHSIKMSNILKSEYEIENNFVYDVVIRCRPDFEYLSPLNLETLKLVKDNNIILPYDNYAHHTKKCDKFAIGSSKVMDYYSSISNYLLNYEKTNPKDFWDGPNVLDLHLKNKKIDILWIYLDYDYKIRKKSHRLKPKDKEKLIFGDDLLIINL